jgi:molybdate transport system substrate-binding protein
MARWNIIAAAGAGLIAALAQSAATEAAEIRVLTARAIATVLEKIGPEFERTTGHKLDVVSGFGPVFVRQINAGDPFDVLSAYLPPPMRCFKDGKLLGDSRTNLVRSGTGVAVRTGAPKPDISSVEAFKQALLNAKSIG